MRAASIATDCRGSPTDGQFPDLLVTRRQHGKCRGALTALAAVCLARNSKTSDPGVTAPGIGAGRVPSGRNGDESYRTLPLRTDQLRGRDRPNPGQDLPLHRLSNPHGHRFSHERVELARHLCPQERDTEDLHQDGGKREQAGARILPRMRHTALFDGSGPQPDVLRPAVGALDRRAELRPTRQGWCRSALPWSMDISGVERFERQP